MIEQDRFKSFGKTNIFALKQVQVTGTQSNTTRYFSLKLTFNKATSEADKDL